MVCVFITVPVCVVKVIGFVCPVDERGLTHGDDLVWSSPACIRYDPDREQKIYTLVWWVSVIAAAMCLVWCLFLPDHGFYYERIKARKCKAVEQQYTGWSHVAKMHLLEYQPKLAAELKKEGRFKEYLQRLGLNASDMYESLLNQGTDHLQATEIVKHELILKPDIDEEESPEREEPMSPEKDQDLQSLLGISRYLAK